MEPELGVEEELLLALEFDNPQKFALPSDIAHLLPFYQQSEDELQRELWVEGGRRWSARLKNWPRGRDRGNYIKTNVLSRLRIQAKATRLRVSWNLEAMWDYLPNELIYSIFGFLHPIDLYHAIRATKSLRRFLLDRNSTSIWRESFLNHPDIPFYPDDVSSPKWVSMIFGPATCDVCGMDNALMDYTLRRRECSDCAVITTVPSYRYDDDGEIHAAIRGVLGDFNDLYLADVWRVALKISRFSAFQDADVDAYAEPLYSVDQVVGVTREMHRHILDIQSDVQDAESKYEAFMNVTEAAMRDRSEQAKVYNVWAYSIYMKRGHDPRDVKEALNEFGWMIYDSWTSVSDNVLSKPRLRKYLPMLESLVDGEKASRLQSEHMARVNARKERVAAFYSRTTKRFITYRKQSCFPDLTIIYDMSFFADYVNDQNEGIVELEPELAQQELLQFGDAFVDAKKHRLYELLLGTGLLAEKETAISDPGRSLELAVAIFECCSRTFIGWEEACAHMRLFRNGVARIQDARDATFLMHYSDAGYQALKNLASILNIGPVETLLPKDLDALNKRFVCKKCPLERKAGLCGLPSLTWRECLEHAALSRDQESEECHAEYDILTEVMTANILALEQPFPSSSEPIWSCNHCTTYIEPLTRKDAIAHAQEVHDIHKATAPIDFDFLRTPGFPIRYPLFVGLDDNANHRCLRCPRSHKLWPKKEPDLFRHFLDKHGIESQDILEGVDWVKIRAVEDDTWIRDKLPASREI
ncbi:hypothetical protein BDN70DRAFT_237123 [Pholiota conissans]|uniref:F-box domain-containing protein n=1 Tax=Pholiota conissans TaxID=109636 RepID=A0A9P5ZED4_9AGAR|nr:hypothetical protein BDN70DRAFT_237123 [Pholiota conissans]